MQYDRHTPYWSQHRKRVSVNAKCETVAHLSSFSEPFRDSGSIHPASGFYESRAEGKKKVPMHFRLASGGVMGFAGIWEKWTDPDGKRFFTCCVITTPANELVSPYHDRMPAILSPMITRGGSTARRH